MGRASSATTSHSIVAPPEPAEAPLLKVAVSFPGTFSWPPAHTKPSHVSCSASAEPLAFMRLRSSPYVFSSVKTKKAKRWSPKTTDGSGKSKLNFMNERPRGGMNTSLVEDSSTMSPGAYTSRTSTTVGSAAAAVGTAPTETAAPAPATVFSQSRREKESVMGRAGGPPKRTVTQDPLARCQGLYTLLRRQSWIQYPMWRRQPRFGPGIVNDRERCRVHMCGTRLPP